MGAQGRKGTRKRGTRLFFLPVVPRALRSSPVARVSRSLREMPEEEAVPGVLLEKPIFHINGDYITHK